MGHARSSDGVGGVAKHKHPLAGKVGGIHRLGVPLGARGLRVVADRCAALFLQASERTHLGDEIQGGIDAIGNALGKRLAALALQPLRGGARKFGVDHHIEICVAQAAQVVYAGLERRHHVDVHPQLAHQRGDFFDIVPVAKPQCSGAENIAQRPATRHRRAGVATGHQGAHQVVKSLGGAPVFLALVGRQLQGHDGNGQVQRQRQSARVVLNQLSRARRAHQHGLGLKPFMGLTRRRLEQLGRVAAQVTGLEGGVGHRGAARQALNHGEQQVSVGVALRGVQHIVHIGHGRSHPHGADMGRAFVGPQGELHAFASGREFDAPAQRAAKEFGQVCGLLITLDGREHQLNRPLGGQALRLQRIGQAQAADHDVGRGGVAAV